MKILHVSAGRSLSASLLTVETEIEGKRFDFVSYAGGTFEVYLHLDGLAMFCGYLPPNADTMLRVVLLRSEHRAKVERLAA